jgi:lipoate-protein ligase A
MPTDAPSPSSLLPPRFTLLPDAGQPQHDLALEQRLLDLAAAGGAHAAVWQCAPALVVPPSYRRFEPFEAECTRFAAAGWPVSVRRSGGGLVPQGPGVVHLSLAWRTPSGMGEAMEAIYLGLCGLLQQAFEAFGLHALAQAVEGSFCDGRFNLALHGRKAVGTAQYWKRVSPAEHVVLAHACVLVDADLALLVRRANEFEAALGSGRRYGVEAVTNLAAQRPNHDAPALSAATFAQRLAQLVAGRGVHTMAPPPATDAPQAPLPPQPAQPGANLHTRARASARTDADADGP